MSSSQGPAVPLLAAFFGDARQDFETRESIRAMRRAHKRNLSPLKPVRDLVDKILWSLPGAAPQVDPGSQRGVWQDDQDFLQEDQK
jgi:hypothetical protein